MDRDTLLVEILQDAQACGYLGPEPVEHHIEHSRDLADAVGPFRGTFLDLGSGGGVPGLVLAISWPDAAGILLESQRRRCELLERALERLDLGDRIAVREGRAEDLARDPLLRGQVDLVVARAFGRPAVTAECAVGFLRAGGRLVVTEPPAGTAHSLAALAGSQTSASSGSRPRRRCAPEELERWFWWLWASPRDTWPRRVGRPAKSPLW